MQLKNSSKNTAKSIVLKVQKSDAPKNKSQLAYELCPFFADSIVKMAKLTWDSFPFNFSRLSQDIKLKVIDYDGSIREFAAHQFLLAGISKKFCECFYDPSKVL